MSWGAENRRDFIPGYYLINVELVLLILGELCIACTIKDSQLKLLKHKS